MKPMFLVIGLASLAALPHGPAFAEGSSGKVRESIEISDHFVFGTTTRVHGATTLIRDLRDRVVHATVTSSVLEPFTAYSMWWAVFNHPRFCVVPFECSTADLEIRGGDTRVKASVFYAGGFVSDGSGSANTSLRLQPGRTGRELFAQSKNFGLKNLRGAEIHLVLRTHGPAGMAGPVAQQIGTAAEACPPMTDSSPGCENVFASFHPPRD